MKRLPEMDEIKKKMGFPIINLCMFTPVFIFVTRILIASVIIINIIHVFLLLIGLIKIPKQRNEVAQQFLITAFTTLTVKQLFTSFEMKLAITHNTNIIAKIIFVLCVFLSLQNQRKIKLLKTRMELCHM